MAPVQSNDQQKMARRQPLFDIDDSSDNQYLFTSLRYDKHAKCDKTNMSISCKDAKNTYLFKYHCDRLREAAGCRGWYDAQKCEELKRPERLYERLLNAVYMFEKANGTLNNSNGPYKIRIEIQYHGKVRIQVASDLSPHKDPLLYPRTLDIPSEISSPSIFSSTSSFKHMANPAHRSNIFKVMLDALPTTKSLHTKAKTEYRGPYDYARMGAHLESYQDAKEVLLFNADGEIMDASITTPYFHREGIWITPHVSCGGQHGTSRRYALDHGLCKQGIVKVDSLCQGEIIWLSNAVKGFFTARYVNKLDRCEASMSFRSMSSLSCTPSVSITPSTTTTGSSASSLSAVETPEAWEGLSEGINWSLDRFRIRNIKEEDDDMDDISPTTTRQNYEDPIIEEQSKKDDVEEICNWATVNNQGLPLFNTPQY